MAETRKQPVPNQTAKRENGERRKPRSRQEPHPAEWLLGGLSALLVVFMIGFVLYDALSATDGEAELNIAVEQIEETPSGGYRVDFRAINGADKTAAGVGITGRVSVREQTIEAHTVTFDYIPAHSERAGSLLFVRDPREAELRIQVDGYRDP